MPSEFGAAFGGKMNSANTRRVIAAGTIGNVLEWYDFAIYGYFAAQIGRYFFPHEDAVAQLLSAFGVFAIGYLMRPIGGVIVGHIGDTFGRRAALIFSVAAMAIPTFLIGLCAGLSDNRAACAYRAHRAPHCAGPFCGR
jgi:MHS family proline/betaine transporter-like MFS transporter